MVIVILPNNGVYHTCAQKKHLSEKKLINFDNYQNKDRWNKLTKKIELNSSHK